MTCFKQIFPAVTVEPKLMLKRYTGKSSREWRESLEESQEDKPRAKQDCP